ncbi:MAG: hypothetical protein ACXVJD_15335 [Mucilaginibacter sp.]
MKNYLSLIALSLLLLNACKKDPAKINGGAPTILLTKIIYNTDDSVKGKTAATFTYNGKQLIVAKLYVYSSVVYTETDEFSYDTNGSLITIHVSHSDDQNSGTNYKISYNGNNINSITSASADFLEADTILLNYQGGTLSGWGRHRYLLTDEDIFNYGNENIVKDVFIAIRPAMHNIILRDTSTTNYLTFDTKNNLSKSLPFWIFFKINWGDYSLGDIPGLNNPTTYEYGYGMITKAYQYNSYGYPSAVTFDNGLGYYSYKYEYIEAH